MTNREFREFSLERSLYVRSFAGEPGCKLLDFRAWVEDKEKKRILVCGIYDLVCYFKVNHSGREEYTSRCFRGSFVDELETPDFKSDGEEEMQVEINIIGAPEIKFSKNTWLDYAGKYLPFIPVKIKIDIKGAYCCEIGKRGKKKAKCKLAGDDIICLSSTRWGGLKQRPRQLMERMSEKNRVIFVEYPVPAHQEIIRQRLEQPVKWEKHLESIDDNFLVFSPLHLETKTESGREFNHQAQRSSLRYLVNKLKIDKPVVITYLPRSAAYVDEIEPDLLVYDCVDNFSAFSWSPPDTKVMEKQLLERVDLITASSRELYGRLKRSHSDTYYLPNGVEFSHFNTAYDPGQKKDHRPGENPGPVIGFVGAFFEWIDEELLLYLSNKKPDWKFVFVGPVQPGCGRKLYGKENVLFTGEKRYQDLPPIMRQFDICIIPFRINKLTRYANPVKVWEYLAAGRPVVSTPLPAVSELSPLIYIADNKPEFLEKLELALREDDYLLTLKRLLLARDNDWDRRAENMLRLLAEYK